MENLRVLYQINVLEKVIAREIIKSCNSKLISPPTPTQMRIMDYIIKHQNEKVFQKDLEDVLGLRRATVSGVLITMEKNGLIKRVVSNSDRRIKEIRFNKDTEMLFGKHKEKFVELERVVECGISEEELEEFVKTLMKMQENIINYSNKK